jgi:hypothetical protein
MPMTNPFRVRWLEGWTFQTVLLGGRPMVEAHGYGICLRTELLQGESPRDAADRLVLEEDRRRRSLRNAWKRGPQHLLQAVIDGDEVPDREPVASDTPNVEQQLQKELCLSPRQEVMQGLGR